MHWPWEQANKKGRYFFWIRGKQLQLHDIYHRLIARKPPLFFHTPSSFLPKIRIAIITGMTMVMQGAGHKQKHIQHRTILIPNLITITIFTLQNCLDNTPRHMVWLLGWLCVQGQELDMMILVSPFQHNIFCDTDSHNCLRLVAVK